MADLRDHITAYGRMRAGQAKTNLGASLLHEGARLDEEIKRAEAWLNGGWSRGNDEDFIEALHQYEEIVDLREEIRRAIFG